MQEGYSLRQRSDGYMVFLLLFGVLSLNIFVKFWIDKHLSLDGVNYFFHILEGRGFADIAWSRRYTEYLTEWPLVLVVKLGLTEIEYLIDVFALGIYFPYLLSFALCIYAVRDGDKSLLWFPLAGYLGFNVLSDYDMIADHHVLAVITWPILLIMMKARPLQWLEGCVLWLLLIAYSRMYETAILTAGILSFIVMVRIYLYRSPREQIIMWFSLLLLIVVVYIGVQYIIEPRSPQNRGAFIDSLWVNRRNWEAIASGSFLMLIGIGWLINTCRPRLKNITFIVALVPIGIYAYLRLSDPDYVMTAYLSFSSRTLVGVIIPALMVGCALVVIGRRKLTNAGVNVFVTGFLIMIAFNLYDLRHWASVKAEFVKSQKVEKMFLPIGETALGDNQLELRHHRWSWNNPLLSLVWAEGCVRTIMLNEPDGPQGPFDPQKTLVLKKYLKYDPRFKAIDPSVEVCP